MAFSFSSGINAPPPASPVERRQRPLVRWFDSAVTIDSWLVEVYFYAPDDTTGILRSSFYVIPRSRTNNNAQINIAEYIEAPNIETPYIVFNTVQAPFPSAKAPQVMFSACDGWQFQIYSVTGGVKSSLQGSFNYLPLNYGKKQKWNFDEYVGIFDYYPISSTVKGWLTDREVTDSYIRYDMAVEDEGVANALYLGNYDYEFETGKNTNEASWDEVKYTIYDRGNPVDFLTLDKPADATGFASGTMLTIPIGPANIKDNAGWINGWDINVQSYDYIEIKLVDSSEDDAQKGRAIRVYPDCRPHKHKPAQLYWMGTKGAEMLRFDGRVQDSYDVSGRESFMVNQFFDGLGSGQNYGGINQFLPEFYQQQSFGKRSFSLSEDFFTQAERELFKTAVTSTHMMVRYDGKWYPCILKTTNYTHEQASSRLAPIRIEVEVSQALLC